MAPATCYFCLEEGGDAVGEEPLVRDCSCRGESAGYAHKSCIIQFATMKSKQDKDDFERAWHTCPNCNQQYQNQLRLDIASAYLEFAETTYGQPDNNGDLDKRKIMNALKVNIDSILQTFLGSKLMQADVMKPALRVQGENLLNKLLSMTLQVKKDTDISSWRHMPKVSWEYQEYKQFSYAYEAYSYERLGMFYSNDRTKESHLIAIKHWKKALVIFKLIGCESESNFTATKLAMARDMLREGNGTTAPIRQDTQIRALKSINERYQHDVKAFGKHDHRTIRTGIEFADLFRHYDHIKAERLITKLSDSSRQVLGQDHSCTKDATHLMNYCKKRFVLLLPDKTHEHDFQALRYDDDGDTLVVNGPIQYPRQVDDEREFHVTSDLVIPMLGCPVVCHGLTGATHLNGKLGQVRSAGESKTGFRAEVLFEDKNLKPASVKLENLRIIFDLPTEAEVEM